MSKQVKECASPPTEDVEWVIWWTVTRSEIADLVGATAHARATARTAWLAHQQVKGAPAFGSCRVVRVTEESK